MIAIVFLSCSETPEAPVNTALIADPEIQALIDAADRRESEVLLRYLNDSTLLYRELAAHHAASFNDTTLLPGLINALESSSVLLRKNAAFALGQQGSEAPYPQLVQYYSTEKNTEVRSELLIAAGRSLPSSERDAFLVLLENAPCEEAPLWAAYFSSLGEAQNQQLVALAFEHLECNQKESRLAAANFLSRSKGIDLTGEADRLIRAFQTAETTERIALALALRHCPHPEVAIMINEHLGQEEDERVLVNLLRTAQVLKIARTEHLLALLKHEYLPLTHLAADLLVSQELDAAEIEALERLEPPTDDELAYTYVMAHYSADSTEYRQALQDLSAASDNPYEKAQGLEYISDFPGNYAYLRLHLDDGLHPAVSTTAAQVLLSGNLSDKERDEVADLILRSQDSGMLAVFAEALMREGQKFKAAQSMGQLNTAIESLSLPREIETYNMLVSSARAMGDSTYTEVTPEYNHPIDFEVLVNYGDTAQAEIHTEKGIISLELYTLASPGSAASFIELANSGFYNNKAFHRVVPSFVIQDGCPRGDGYGSVDYSIRSEFGLHHYRSGTLGMASAGKDTESCQWFITHCPTPHLEGRYSIFGQVTDGMNVVRLIEPGDKIEKIVIK